MEVRPDCVSYEITEKQLTFNSPAEWAKGLPPVRFRRRQDGRYEYRSARLVFDAMRADTQSHILLTGRWADTNAGKGVFIAILPMKQAVEIVLESTATVPVVTNVSQLVSAP